MVMKTDVAPPGRRHAMIPFSRLPIPSARARMGVGLWIAAQFLTGSAHAGVPVGPPTFSDPLTITNVYQPVAPGQIKVFKGHKGSARSVIVDLYLDATRTFQVNNVDVPCRIVQETEFEGGHLAEISRNFFAQADDGSVYYFGEIVDTYDNGQIVDHEGSWLVGGATDPNDPVTTAGAPAPSLFMPATPETGDVFKQEDLLPVVDETDTIRRVGQTVTTPAGRMMNCLRVLETSVLDPASETKWYAPGLGAVRGHTRGEDFALVVSAF